MSWLLLFWLNLSQSQTCNSTIFGYGDRTDGGAALGLGRRVRPGDYGIAHRSWPMGTRVIVCNLRTDLCNAGVVLDRGPYGAVGRNGEWFIRSPRINPKRRGKYLGCADLTPSLAQSIGHDGRDRVRIWRLRDTTSSSRHNTKVSAIKLQ